MFGFVFGGKFFFGDWVGVVVVRVGGWDFDFFLIFIFYRDLIKYLFV